MSPTPVVVPGPRDVRGSLDAATEATPRVVVACPPHPQFGGDRSDRRLRAVSDALGERAVDCLRIDYGPWDEGPGELQDAIGAVEWARERYSAVGLFGYSFGGAIALLAAARGPAVRAVSALAPADRIDEDLDAGSAVGELDCPVQVVYGERDDVVDAELVAEAVRAAGGDVVAMGADHHFVGQDARVGETVGPFLAANLEG